MNTLIQDLRYALRTLARSPGFAAAAVATLALGIGANTAIFSVLHAVLWKPMPYERPDELVRITGTYTGQGVVVPQTNVSPLDALDWREQCRSLSGVGVFTTGSVALTGSGEPLRLRNGVASTNLLSVLGVRPVLGRDFTPDDEIEGHHRVALLAHGRSGPRAIRNALRSAAHAAALQLGGELAQAAATARSLADALPGGSEAHPAG